MNEPVCLGLSTLELSKIVMYEFCYDYVKPNMMKSRVVLYGYRQFHGIHKNNISKDIAEVIETRFDTSNNKLECNSIDRPLPKGRNKKSYWIDER